VRGDKPRVAESEAHAEAIPSPQPNQLHPTNASAESVLVEGIVQPSAASEPLAANGNGGWLTPGSRTVRRQAPVEEQLADLEAFRAVANESARRAISSHGLRKHRRKAVTKMVVATLAGLTSVLLMLEAPDLRDLQFIAACVSLLATAYWAGQTCGALLESFRAASYDGPKQDLNDLADPFHPALPIDVDR
jgi:hypothetical protein